MGGNRILDSFCPAAPPNQTNGGIRMSIDMRYFEELENKLEALS